MLVCGAMVGLVAGIGAIGFRILIAVVHNLVFLGVLDWRYDTSQHTPASPFGVWIILGPVAGAIVVAFLVKTFAPEARGHGVPEVMDAIFYNSGIIRPVVAAIKSLASAISIGSGGSVGREGPIVQVGAAFGSTLGQWVPKTTASQRSTLVAAGAAGGIAATFNTPIGGMLFAVELMLASISPATILPVALATVIATVVGRYAFGLAPAFSVPELALPATHIENPVVLLGYAACGLLLGCVAALFVKGIYWFEDRFDAMPGNYYSRHAIGMLLVGIVLYAFQSSTGYYYVQGVGYATVGDVLHQRLAAPLLLLLLCGAKLLVTYLTLGSGASGGIFSPCLFIGATFGGAFALLLKQFFPSLDFSPASFAIVGMAAMVAGSTGLLITVSMMIFEMTRDYSVILPVILAVAISCYVRKTLSPGSIYTLKLLRRGHVVHEGMQAALDVALRPRCHARFLFHSPNQGTSAAGLRP